LTKSTASETASIACRLLALTATTTIEACFYGTSPILW